MNLEAVPWTELGRVPPDELEGGRIELHGSVQLLGAFGQAHVEPRPDYSHRSMMWNAGECGFFSEPARAEPRLRVALRPRDLTLSIRAGDVVAAKRSLVGGTLEEAYRWLEDQLEVIQREPRVELGRPENVIPPGQVADGGPFSGGEEGHLLQLEAWFSNAAAILDGVRPTHTEATPVRGWPHHCDIATLLVLDAALGAEDGPTVGVGLSPGDGAYSAPYFYVTPHPYPAAVDLPELPGGAHWHRDGWVGAVMTAEALISAGGAADQEEACRSFLATAIGAATSLLAG